MKEKEEQIAIPPIPLLLDMDRFTSWVYKKDLEITIQNIRKDIENIKAALVSQQPYQARTYADLRGVNADLNEPITQEYANLCEPSRTNNAELREPIKHKAADLGGLKRTPRTNKNFKDNLIREIIFYIKQSYSTTEIKENIMLKFNIKKTCFFKYLKLAKEYLRAVVID